MKRVGIWQGRFQPVHKGHYTMFKNELLKFDEQFIAIVNPSPNFPPVEGFDNFSLSNNPFSYFDRMFIWKTIINDYNLNKSVNDPVARITFIPCWHARKCLMLENEFLPDRTDRAWIIPVDRDCTEERKADDLSAQGENICDVECDKTCINITATYIRRHINDFDINEMLPSCTVNITRDLLRGTSLGNFYIVPFIGDKINPASIQYAVDTAQKTNSGIVFVVTVKVATNAPDRYIDDNNLPWWFKPSDHTDGRNDISYYQKSLMLNNLMNRLGITNYYITPIFVKGDTLSSLSSYNNSFLPSNLQSQWVINQSEQYLYGFNNYLRNINARRIIFDGEVKCSQIILDFFNDLDNSDFINNSIESIDIVKLISEIKISKRTLTEWVSSNTPGAQERLATLNEIEIKYNSGTSIRNDEFINDRVRIDLIKSWINNNKIA